MNVQRGLWPETLVAGLATLSVGWPLTTLLQEQSWLFNAVGAVALVVITGAALRSLRALPSLIVVSQVLVGALTLCGMYLQGTLWLIFPTADSASLAVELLAEAGEVLREFAAPAPTTTGVAFLVVAVLVLTAVSVDALALTCAAPAIAGLPLVAAFFVSVSNNGSALAPWFFLVTAALWMMMMAQQSDRLLARWPSADNQGFGARPRFGGTYRALAQTLGVLGLCAALGAAALLPHLPPTFFADGLGRNPEANGRNLGAGQVSFTETMDPGADLANQSESPVLEYTSTARLLQPLRVTATEEFDGQTWVAPERGGAPINGPDLPAGQGVSADVVGSAEEVSVTVNNLRAPHLAIPAATTSLSIDGPSFEYNEDVNAVLVNAPVDDYVARYVDIAPDGPVEPPGPSAEAIGSATPALLEVPSQSQAAITDLGQQILGDEADPLEVGRLVQEHFRSSGYTYSLALAPRDPDVSGDAITQFLASRQGYCVQFSTAMVMLARSEGIPARMAVGFLPGEVQSDGSRRVRAKDAHTWPELYIDGLGWTRFEPTPGVRTGVAPTLTQPETAPTAPAEVPAVSEQAPPTVEPPTPNTSDNSWWQAVTDWIVKWRWVWVGLLILGVALCAQPLAGRWYRGRESRQAQTATEYVESQWLVLTRSLTDLGVEDPGPQSPAAMHAHYAERTSLDSTATQALGRVTARLQDTRYAAPRGLTIDEDQVTSDVLTVVDTVRARAPWHVRTKAALVPRSGAVGLAQWARRRAGRD